MPALEAHMLRVAAVASLICDNFDESISKEEILTACLLHDMGNIIKSDFKLLPEFLEPKGFGYWEKVKADYIKKYGGDSHEATLEIIKELGSFARIVVLIDQVRFRLLCSIKDDNNFSVKIISYADGRVDPHGVVSYDERMNEVKERYKGREHLFPLKDRERLINCGKEIEKQIFAKCKIKPEDINNETVTPIILNLRNFMIK